MSVVNRDTGIAKRLLQKLNNPPPHAEAYIASPLVAGDGKYKHREGASGCLNLI